VRLGETRTRSIQVVSQHKVEVGVTQRNAHCRLIDVVQFSLQSFGFRCRELCSECVFYHSEPPIKLAQGYWISHAYSLGAKPKTGKTIANVANENAIALCT
jgi:hypothetical protein